MVLGRRADHGGSADVDVLDAGVEVCAPRHCCFERIEADDEEIDRLDAVRAHCGIVMLIVPQGQQAAVHFGMQGLHSTVHHLRKAGQLGNVAHAEPSLGQRLASAAGRDQLD